MKHIFVPEEMCPISGFVLLTVYFIFIKIIFVPEKLCFITRYVMFCKRFVLYLEPYRAAVILKFELTGPRRPAALRPRDLPPPQRRLQLLRGRADVLRPLHGLLRRRRRHARAPTAPPPAQRLPLTVDRNGGSG